ncbi:MAG: DDE-type integrase/transposase/recombinase [Candidatus Coprovivens sp.]
MTDQEKEKIALFRYGIISPVISNIAISMSKKEYFKQLGEKEYLHPNGYNVKIEWKTIERWYYQYKRFGFEGLKPRDRNDRGKLRKLDDEVIEIIDYYIKKYPRMPATSIHEKLIADDIINVGDVSTSTITRYIKRLKGNSDIITKKEFRRYEAEHINDIWCCDTTYSFKLTVNGVKKRMYIIAIIDDASRVIVGCDVFFEDNYVNFMSVLKSAVKKYGKPKLLNVDNGAPYKNNQISLLAARLGVTLHHCEAYQPTSKGKIERWNRTMKDHFMATYHLTTKTTIEEFRNDLLKYVIEYNNKEHSELGKSPFNRFFESNETPIYIEDDLIEKSFLLEIERKASIDGVIPINNVEYEVPSKYANKRIKLRYSSDCKQVYVVNPDGTLDPIQLLDKISNSKIVRNKPRFNVEDNE